MHGSVEHAVLDGSLILHAAVERASADGAAEVGAVAAVHLSVERSAVDGEAFEYVHGLVERAVLDRAASHPHDHAVERAARDGAGGGAHVRFCGIVRVAVEGSTCDDARVSDACGERAAPDHAARFVAHGETGRLRRIDERAVLDDALVPKEVLARDVERVARERERVPRAKRELAVGVRPAFSRRADRRAVGADFDGDGNSARECDVWVEQADECEGGSKSDQAFSHGSSLRAG